MDHAQMPLSMVLIGTDSTNRVVYWMPPNPVADPRCQVMTYDWIKHPELWDNRNRVSIGGLAPDGEVLITRNFQANSRLDRFKPDWKNLWGAEKGKIALLLSCGPSLTESMPEIRKLARNRNQYFTIGLNRSLRAHELDYWFISDRRGSPDWTENREYPDTRLIAGPCVTADHPRKFKQRFWGEQFYAQVPDTGNTRMSTEMAITICDTMYAAYKLGAREIWLYGCDFACSGKTEDDNEGRKRFKFEKYYHDTSYEEGMEIRKHLFPVSAPTWGINNRMVFANWELMCYAAYASTMAYMIENSGGVPVRNKTPCGIMWETWHGTKLLDAVCLRAAETPQSDGHGGGVDCEGVCK